MAGAVNALPGMEVSVAQRSRRRDLAEIALSYGLIYAVEWTPRPWQKYLWWIAALIIFFLAARSFEGIQVAGLRKANFFRSSWLVGVALLIAAASIGFGAQLHTLRFMGGPGLFIETYWAYALWSGLQQFLMQCFFLARLVRLLPTPRLAVIAATALFALAHMPNLFLILVTVLWGMVACFTFLHYRNLWTVSLAHAILGITIAIAVPGPVDHNMRVGLGYLRYRPGTPPPQRSQRDQIASTVAWVMAAAPTRRSLIHARP